MQSSATADPVVLIIAMSVVTPLLVLLYLYPPRIRSLRAWSSRRVASSGFADKVYRKLPKYLVIMGGCAKILLGYCQCLSAVQRFPLIVWPHIFYRFMEILDEVNIELFSTVPAECITGNRLGLYYEMLATLLIPIACFVGTMLLIIALNVIHRACARVEQKNRRASTEPAPANDRETALSRSLSRSGTMNGSFSSLSSATTRRGPPVQLGFWALIARDCNRPKVWKLMIWVMLFCYPSLARKSLSVFDCVEAGEDEAGMTIFLLRSDPAERCYEGAWTAWAVLAGTLGIGFYCVGFPLASFLISWNYHYRIERYSDDRDAYERISVVVSTYSDEFWYVESISLLHKAFFTGVIHIIEPGTRIQIWSGVVGSLFIYILFLLSMPYKHDVCDWLQAAALLQLLLTYVSAFLFFDDGSEETSRYRNDEYGIVLVLINCLCFMVLILWTALHIFRQRRMLRQRRLRYVQNDAPCTPRPLGKGLEYHLFLSHVWRTGQDAMRVVKERLLEVLPGLEIFLDVDVADLDIGDLEGYIAATDVVLIYLTQGYLQSRNCMRELTAATQQGKHIIALLDSEPSKGVSVQEAKNTLSTKSVRLTNELVPELRPPRDDPGGAIAPATLMEWNVSEGDAVSAGEVLCWLSWAPKPGGWDTPETAVQRLALTSPLSGSVYSLQKFVKDRVHIGDVVVELHDPEGAKIASALFAREVIEWERLSAFQDVSLRLIGMQLLPLPTLKELAQEVYIANELAQQQKTLIVRQPRKGKDFHVYMSKHNSGATELIEEINTYLSSDSISLRSGDLRQNSPLRHLSRSGGPSGGTTRRLLGDAVQLVEAAVQEVQDSVMRSLSSRKHHRRVLSTDKFTELKQCEAMLLYLNGSTWTREDCSLRLSAEVAKAMAAGIPLVLAHEMPDVREHSKAGSRSADRRNGCPFHMFIEQTPEVLLKAEIYRTIAVPLKTGAPRQASRALLVQKLGEHHAQTEPRREVVNLLRNAARDFTGQIESRRATLERRAAEALGTHPVAKPGRELSRQGSRRRKCQITESPASAQVDVDQFLSVESVANRGRHSILRLLGITPPAAKLAGLPGPSTSTSTAHPAKLSSMASSKSEKRFVFDADAEKRQATSHPGRERSRLPSPTPLPEPQERRPHHGERRRGGEHRKARSASPSSAPSSARHGDQPRKPNRSARDRSEASAEAPAPRGASLQRQATIPMYIV